MYLYVSHQQAEGAVEPGDYIYTYQMTPQITLHADVYIITTHADVYIITSHADVYIITTHADVYIITTHADLYIKDTYGHTDTMYMYCV